MFDIGWTELMVVAVVAIVVIGPKDLPAALRTFGKWTGKMKRMARDFQGQFNEALREAELDDVKKQMTDVKKQMADIGRIDPMADLKSDLTKTHGEIQSSLNKPADSELKLLAADTGTDEPAPVAEAEKPAVAEAAPPPAAPETAKTSVPAPETSVAAAADAKP